MGLLMVRVDTKAGGGVSNLCNLWPEIAAPSAQPINARAYIGSPKYLPFWNSANLSVVTMPQGAPEGAL